MSNLDQIYSGIPWKDGGCDRATGVDCKGLAVLWLREQMGLDITPPEGRPDLSEVLAGTEDRLKELERGDIVFFRVAATKGWHCAVHLGRGRLLHIVRGGNSRIENGFTLLRRVGCEPFGAVPAADAERLARALDCPALGDPATLILLAIAVVLSIVSALLVPGLPRLGNKYGRYGFDALVTQNSPEVPLPDLLGSVVVAGNSPYQQLQDKGASTSATTKANKVVILSSGPVEAIDYMTGLRINGLNWNDKYFHDGTNVDGIYIDPAQSKAEAVTGNIGGDSDVPSVSLYSGTHGITVPVDVRAQYDRTFPIYGFSGCAYLVFRLVDPAKFNSFNMTCRVKGRKCRTFTSAGFTVTTITGESLTGADGSKVRFKLAFEDIKEVTSITVNGTSHTEISESQQAGNVYALNKTKGYVEFITAPAASATVSINYKYYARAWTQNPASHLVYLLTEPLRGKGFDESRIDWAAAVSLRDYCDADVAWVNADGTMTGDRYQSNYALDFRKPVPEHLRAVLDACWSHLTLSQGKFLMRARKAETSVFSFTTSNILEGSFSSELVDRSERANRVKLFYHSEESHNAETEVAVDDPYDQASRAARLGNFGVVEENLKFPAVTGQSQAERLANQFLREQVNSRHVCEFTTTTKALALEIGDVVDITHPSQPRWAAKLFRVEEIGHDSEGRMTLKFSEYVDSAYI